MLSHVVNASKVVLVFVFIPSARFISRNRRTAISKCAKRLRNLRLKIPLTYGVPFFIIEHIMP